MGRRRGTGWVWPKDGDRVALAAARVEIRALQAQLAKRNWQALVAQLQLAEMKRAGDVKDPAEPSAGKGRRSQSDSAYEGSKWATREEKLALREAHLEETGDSAAGGESPAAAVDHVAEFEKSVHKLQVRLVQ